MIHSLASAVLYSMCVAPPCPHSSIKIGKLVETRAASLDITTVAVPEGYRFFENQSSCAGQRSRARTHAAV